MKYRFVTINGPLGVGKTWVVQQLLNHIYKILVVPVSWQDPLRKACYELCAVDSSVPYDTFKKMTYFGRTGREWMIRMSEDFAKEHSETFFSEVLAHRIMNSPLMGKGDFINFSSVIFVADSNGFASELMYFKAHAAFDVLACCIEPPGSPPRGELWRPDDSRYNLAHMCDIVLPDSTTAFHKLMEALTRRGWI